MHEIHTKDKDWFSRRIIRWQKNHGRNNLPWQVTDDAYPIWISEIMLQQTQVQTVIPYFQRFISRFPNVAQLANASEDEVLACWSGLGYYARGRHLRHAARLIMERHQGRIPNRLDDLMNLPGIGRTTAAAILSQAFGQRQTILDGNVKRVLCRFHALEGWPGSRTVEQRLWKLAEQHLPENEMRTYTQGLMDLGAMICLRKNPLCESCAISENCKAHLSGTTSRYPSARPARIRPQKSSHVLILTNSENHILLQKRPSSGIWGGLWSLPQIETDASDINHYAGIKYEALACTPPVRHQFTHFQLTLYPILARTRSRGKSVEPGFHAWYNQDEIHNIGMPAPIAKLLGSTWYRHFFTHQ
ncbi:MAG: A/G-specific adenine glycosylase [Gammaproteobacteria bacterium]|nr:MAG: A/G-specific adenine glycosylase [Gammaproteobacteria bacterium]